MQVDLKAAFGGLSWLPWWLALRRSNLSPSLALNDDGIAYRVIASAARRYDEIASVDFRKAIGTRNILIAFSGSSWTFSGNVVDDGQARNALAFLRDKGCPLTDRARSFLG